MGRQRQRLELRGNKSRNACGHQKLQGFSPRPSGRSIALPICVIDEYITYLLPLYIYTHTLKSEDAFSPST